MLRIVLVEADAGWRRQVRRALQGESLRLSEMPDFNSLHCAEAAVDVAVCRAERIASDGLAAPGGAAVVALAAAPSVSEAVRCMRLGAVDYLGLDAGAEALAEALDRAFKERAAGLDYAGFPVLAGASPALARLLADLQRLARTEQAVLVRGELGVGKATVGRALHAASLRSAQSLVAFDCALLPPALCEYELFGSGQSGERKLLDAAAGGTLLLENVAELSPGAQQRLLASLEADAAAPVVRVVATARHDLRHAERAGRFEPELRRRLQGAVLNVPSLREREQDMLAIAAAMLKREAAALGRDDLALGADALAAMRDYAWPGNARELAQKIAAAAAQADTEAVLDAHQLGFDAAGGRAAPAAAEAEAAETSGAIERYFVKFVLDNEDRLTETELASQLGISRKNLWERRQRLNIPRRRTRKRGRRSEQ